MNGRIFPVNAIFENQLAYLRHKHKNHKVQVKWRIDEQSKI